MKANVKGFNFEVTVNGRFACASWDEATTRKDIDRDNSSGSKGEGLDINFNVGIKTGAEEYQGELDLREFADAIKTAIDTNIAKQVEKQLDGHYKNIHDDLNNRDKDIIRHMKDIDKRIDSIKKTAE